MIAASLKESEGDQIVDLLLRKGADVDVKSATGQVNLYGQAVFRNPYR
jgi:26S proteasome non-ATPase regulatory subunit 10